MSYKRMYTSTKTLYNDLHQIGGNPNYVEFINSTDLASGLSTDFLNNLKHYTNLLLLRELLTTKALKTIFYEKEIDGVKCYLVIITTSNDKTRGKTGDSLLIELGNKYNFPRGFPIFWIPNKQINTYGFFPKFDNDNRNDISTDKDFMNCTSLRFNYKYSGFLGQIIAFEVNGNKYWSTTAKNSTNNMFSKAIYSLFQEQMTSELLDVLCNEQLHLCGETLSFQDQTHGYSIKKEGVIITSVGRSSWFNIHTSDTSDSLFIPIKTNLVSFLTIDEMFAFAKRFNLKVDSIFDLNSNIIQFMKELQYIRNFLTLDKFEELLTKYTDVLREEKGTISHKDYVGNLLEGLIIKTNTGKVIKYKFPLYTVRTMLLRPNLDDTLNIKFVHEINHFISHWVIDINAERKIWESWLRQFYIQFPEINSFYIGSEYQIKNISKHIFLMDTYTDKFPIEKTSTKKLVIPGEIIEEKINIANIVLSFGPIGGGKSTVSEAICNHPKIKNFFHIDGDLLDLEMSEVINLSSERSDYTLYKIYEALLKNSNIILSTGGGVLMSGKYFVLIEKLKKLLGEKCILNFIVLLGSNQNRVITDYSFKEELLNMAFPDGREEIVNRVIDERNSRYTDEDRINEISRKKMLAINNKNICNEIITNLIDQNILRGIGLYKMSDYVDYNVLSNPETYNYLLSLLMPLESKIYIDEPKFRERRILVSLPNKMMKHITLGFTGVLFNIETDKEYKNKEIVGIQRNFINAKLYNFLEDNKIDIDDISTNLKNYFNKLKKDNKGKLSDDIKLLEKEFLEMLKNNTYYYSLIDCKNDIFNSLDILPHVTLHCPNIHKPKQSSEFLKHLYKNEKIVINTYNPLSEQEYVYVTKLDAVLNVYLKSVFYIL